MLAKCMNGVWHRSDSADGVIGLLMLGLVPAAVTARKSAPDIKVTKVSSEAGKTKSSEPKSELKPDQKVGAKKSSPKQPGPSDQLPKQSVKPTETEDLKQRENNEIKTGPDADELNARIHAEVKKQVEAAVAAERAHFDGRMPLVAPELPRSQPQIEDWPAVEVFRRSQVMRMMQQIGEFRCARVGRFVLQKASADMFNKWMFRDQAMDAGSSCFDPVIPTRSTPALVDYLSKQLLSAFGTELEAPSPSP